MKRSIVFLILVSTLFLYGFFGGDKPSNNELKNALSQKLPSYVEVSSFQ
jgi:hypothetical protein